MTARADALAIMLILQPKLWPDLRRRSVWPAAAVTVVSADKVVAVTSFGSGVGRG